MRVAAGDIVRALRKYVFIGAIVLFGASAFGCGSRSPAPAPASSTADTTSSVAYTVQASAQTRAATGVVSWSIEIDPGDAHVEGHGASNETIVTWTATQSKQALHYDLKRGQKTVTMTIDVTDAQPTMQENTFFGNEELGGVMARLSSDLNQQAAPSADPSGTSSLVQSLAPQNKGAPVPSPPAQGRGHLVDPNSCTLVLVSPSDKCKDKLTDRDNLDTTVDTHCGHDCPRDGLGRLWDDYMPTGAPFADDHCKTCMGDLTARGDQQWKVDDCEVQAVYCLGKNYNACVAAGDLTEKSCCARSLGQFQAGQFSGPGGGLCSWKVDVGTLYPPTP
jgi:hypothetical protein